MVISFDGEVNDDIKFDFTYNLPLYSGVADNHGTGGCPATINGEFFFFGGWHNKVSLFHPRENFYNHQ